MADHPLDELLQLGGDWLVPPTADDRLDELLWDGDMSASLEALERVRGLVLGDLPAAKEEEKEEGAVVPYRKAEANAASARRGKSSMKPVAAAWSSPSSGEEQAQTHSTIAMENSSNTPPSATEATPLVSSMWLNWENPGAATKLSAGLPEDTQELRRLKTRDAMRRSRQRQRDQLQQLRGAVQDLESQYSQLCLVTERDLAVSSRSTDLADAVALSKRLGAENLMLQASIQRQELWRQQLNVVMESRSINASDARPGSMRAAAGAFSSGAAGPESLPFRPEILDPLEAKSVFGFRPLTQEDVKDVILANTRAVKRVQRQLLLGQRSGSGNGEDELTGGKPVAKMDVFGWDVRQRVRGSHMDFVFTKRFSTSVSVSEVMHKSWVGEMHLKGMQKLKYDTKRLEVLQEVGPNAYVLGREVLSPDSTPMFRTTLVRYRMESPPEPFVDDSNNNEDEQRELVASGFVIGTYSINPDSSEASETLPSASSYARELAGDVLWADLTYTIEFRSVADARTGEEQYVEIRWAGSTNYKSQFHAYRNTADKISQLLHWELLHIAPVAQIIPTSPRGPG